MGKRVSRKRPPAKARRETYPRTRLFARLEGANPHSLIWIMAPAGAGKTTLISSYFAARGVTGLWYTLHPGEGDPATFFGRLARVVQAQFPRRRFSLPVLTPEYLAGLSAFTHRYFALLCERLHQPVTFAIDDYQELPPESPVHTILAEGFSQLPPGFRAVIISRNPPPPAFARLHVNRCMEILRWPDLRLTEAETLGLIRHLARKSVPAAHARCLHEQTDGWVAGLILLLEDETRDRSTSELFGLHSRDTLFSFFAGEIFNRLDATEQTVLRRCALLEEMTAHMATQLSGEKAAEQILDQLYRRHCFVERREGPEPVYRWHALFRQFLLARDTEVSTSTERLQAHRVAAGLLEAAGQNDAAIDQYWRAQAWPELIRILIAQAPEWIANGRHRVLAQWIDAIPAALFEQTPALSYWHGVCLLPFDPLGSRSRFEHAFAQFAVENSLTGLLLSWSGAVETFLFLWDDFTGLDPWIAWLEARLPQMAAFPSPQVEARVTLAMFTALVFRRPDHPDLPAWLDRILRLSESSTDPQLRVLALFTAAFYLLWVGRLAEVGALVGRLNQSARHSRGAPVVTLHCKVVAATHAWFTAAFDSAFQAVDDGLAMAEETGAHLWDHRLLSQGVYAALSEGDVEKARTYLVRMSALAQPGHRLDQSHDHYQRACEAFLRSDHPAALEQARSAARLAAEMGTPFPEALCRLGLAQVLHAMGKHDDAQADLDQSRRIARAMNSDYLEFMADLIEVYGLLRTATDPVRVDHLLRRALHLGSERGYINFSFWHPEVMSRVCATALAAGIEPAYVSRLIVKRALLPPPESSFADLEHWPWPVRIYTLGHFSVVIDGKRLQFERKAQRRPIELLRVLISLGGHEVSESHLSEMLWDDAEADAARGAFKSALSRLRKLLGDEVLLLRDNRLSLNPNRVWVDAWAFERLVAQTETAHSSAPEVERILTLYQGPFLGDAETAPWSLPARERLRAKLLRVLTGASHQCLQDGHAQRALRLLEKGLEADPLAEELYCCLMRAHTALDQHSAALASYQRCQKILATQLGIDPGPRTQALYQAVRNSQPLPSSS
ncbi:MAG: BTAD domain-containing putative transcriptional regulator [Acidiferrobacterales bacterium]